MATHQPTSTVWHTVMPSTLGDLTLVRDGSGLRGVYFPHHWHRPSTASFGARRDEGFADAVGQLTEYLSGERRVFELALNPVAPGWQESVWNLLAEIPYGGTAAYGDLAARIGGGVTAQQIGAAVGRNPLSIIVPCHRVIGRNGKLTGYAGGLGRKRHLLELEREQVCRSERIPLQGALIPGW